MTRALVAFGANLGDPVRMFDEVRRRLLAAAGVSAVAGSSLYRTVPVGGPTDQPVFLNGAFAAETTLDVEAFFGLMRAVEADLGRERKESWGPRTIDLDLALFGTDVHSSATLATPHPRLHFRRFVLAPAVEVTPDALHPLLGLTLAEVARSAAELTTGETLLAAVGGSAEERTEAAATFKARYPNAAVVGLPAESVPATVVAHAGTVVAVRPSVHLPGVEDRRLERDLDRVWEAASRRRLWIATTAGFHPGLHPTGDLIVPAVDLRAASAADRRREFLHLIESLAEPVRV